MPVTNQPADNDPDLSRTSPRSVQEAQFVLRLQEHYNRGQREGLFAGIVLATLVCTAVFVLIRHFS